MVGRSACRIGILALQGDVGPHQAVLASLGVDAVPVRSPSELDSLDGLILPGGESTAIGRLLTTSGLGTAIPDHARRRDLPLFGTCAGLILLAKTIRETPDQPHFGLLDITVQRNAFGRQRESCEAAIDAPTFGPSPLRALFIRAPEVVSVGSGVTVLATWQDRIVLVRQDRILAASFHPELAEEDRVHRYFVETLVGMPPRGTSAARRETP